MSITRTPIVESNRFESDGPVSTSILRSLYHPQYIKLVQRGYSSDAYPHTSHPSMFGTVELPIDSKTSDTSTTGRSVYDGRSRETAVLDRFIAFRVGDELRKIETSLTEDTGQEKEIFGRFQVGREFSSFSGNTQWY